FFGFNGIYSLMHAGADQYTLGALPANSDVTFTLPTGLGASAATVQQVGFGFSYSTIVGPDRGPGRLPYEAVFSHVETIAGSGGPVPKTFRDQLELRVYIR